MDISRLLVYAQHVEEDKKKDRNEHLIKMSRLIGHKFNQ